MPTQIEAPDMVSFGEYGIGQLDSALVRKSKEDARLYYVFLSGKRVDGLRIAPVLEGNVISGESVRVTDFGEVYEVLDKQALNPPLKFQRAGT